MTGVELPGQLTGRSKMQNCIQNYMFALARSSEGVRLYKNLKELIVRASEGVVAQAKALVEITQVKVLAIASIQKPERAHCSLERRIRGSSEGTSRNHAS